MSKFTEAHDGLARSEKHPIRIEGGWWRWVLPDPATSDAMEELPKEVFDRLPGFDAAHPWLYRSHDRAMLAATWAVEAALYAGWRPDR
jgi:hypothetical protein